MKLIFCLECHDVVRLFHEDRACRCGGSGGRYTDTLNAEIWGTCVPLGFENRAFAVALQKRPEGPGKGSRFLAFVIPKICDTVRVVDPSNK